MNRDELIRDIQTRYRQSSDTLNELERRHWAAAEALELGRGGITVVSQALRISPNTIKRGMQELAIGQPLSNSDVNARIRKPGGGRKSKSNSMDQVSRTPSNQAGGDTDIDPLARDFAGNNRQDASTISDAAETSFPVDDLSM